MKRRIDVKAIVRRGYDQASLVYRGDQEDEKCLKYHAWVEELLRLVKEGLPILDLGCGCGIPVSQRLCRSHPVTGVDISPVQIERARKLVPSATFICEDMASIEFPAQSFMAIVSLYALYHLDLREQQQLLQKLRLWLMPGGYLMAMVGRCKNRGVVRGWLNIANSEMYFHTCELGTYKTWIQESGFEIIRETMIPEVDDALPLILARTI